MRAKFPRIVVKTLRYTAWPLLILMILFVASGYAMSGEYGFNRMMSVDAALTLHRWFNIPLVLLFVVHACAGAYISFRRWGWIGKKVSK